MGTSMELPLAALFSPTSRSSLAPYSPGFPSPRRTTEDSFSRRIMRFVPVLILETNNKTNNECLPKFFKTMCPLV